MPSFRAAPALAAAALVSALTACGGGPPPGEPGGGAQGAAAVGPPLFPAQNRPDVRGTHGAVSADHPLAAAAGYDVLRRGGTATDAVIAMAAVLAVVRPHMNGVGGDAFALFYDASGGEVTALNGSGRSGALADRAFFASAGHATVPETGPFSVSVPGAVAAWVDAHQRFGRLPFHQLLLPAVGYARDGFPVSTRLAADFAAQGGALNEPGRALYLPGGVPPAVGSILRNPALANTLEAIGRDGKDGFYRGAVAERLGRFVASLGGYLRATDLERHTSTWVEPLRGSYLGHRFLVLPPNTQGVAQLQMMEMAKSFPLQEMGHNTSSYLHTMIEVKKLAFADRDRWVADPAFDPPPLRRLLDPGYLADRARLVDPDRAADSVRSGVRATTDGAEPEPGRRVLDDSGDTVYLTAVDADGNAVSWIQSLFHGFGSGLLEPETGVLLQNRGALFSLDRAHPNVVEPGKRPYHTLTPLMALHEDGDFAFTLGTPGGDSQTQSLLQIVHNVLLFGMTPQEAVEAARFRSYDGPGVAVEDRVPEDVRSELAALGHQIRPVPGWTATFGGAQMIRLEPNGSVTVASDPRREAYGLAY